MKIQPLLNNILVEEIIDTPTGLIVPEDMQRTKSEGKGRIIAVGQGTRNIDGSIAPLLVKKGDIVLFNRYSKVKIEGREYLLIKEEWIVATLKEEKNGK